MSRFEHHIFVCENERSEDHPKGACHSKGGAQLRAYAKERIKELGLKKRVRVNRAGCLDACAKGPVVVIYPQGVWYRLETKEDVDLVLERHILNGEVVEALQIYRPKG